MLGIAAELGLGGRDQDLRRLAVSSARLTAATDAGGSSFAGGEPTVPAAMEVPELGGEPARFVALLDLPPGGRLWVFRSEVGMGAGCATDLDDPAGARVAAVFEPAGDPASTGPPPPPGATRLLASPELTLPRAWSTAVRPLALSRSEQDSWQELRARLATAQGVPLGESAPARGAIHRLGGYPDERRGEMPLICELRRLGVDLEGKSPAAHPLADALDGETGSWRLLAQLATDDDLDWSWGPRYQRLYVWAQVDDLMSDDYRSIQVVVQ